MSGSQTAPAAHWTRPSTERKGPRRSAATIYRTSDHPERNLGGVTLASSEDAAVAAVRMAYRIADAQIERSTRLANRLKGAGDRATGGDSGREAVDAASRLVNNALLSGLAWIEALAAPDDGLASRLAAAQIKAVRAAVFARGQDQGNAPQEAPGQPMAQPSAPVQPRKTAAAATASAIGNVEVVLKGEPSKRRAVRIVSWELEKAPAADVYFHCVSGSANAAILKGTVVADGKRGAQPVLTMDQLPPKAPAGVWRAAVCDDDGVQHGVIEVSI
jgi:hypothetical protein